MPSFLVKEGPLGRGRLEVESQLVLGRGTADVVIDDPEISRRHALIRVVGELVEIDDLDSLNGTWVNGIRIKTTTQLLPGDIVRLGRSVLELESAAAGYRQPDSSASRSGRVFGHGRPLPRMQRRAPEHSPVLSLLRGSQPNGAEPHTSTGHAPGEEQERAANGPARTEDELRPVTALFADIVGSTSLGERLQPHEVKTLVGDCVSRMTGAVERFGGSVQAYMGDGIAAFFGLSAAHEDDPDRAAHAALQILELVTDYALDIATAWNVDDFNVRIGINGGQVAVGDVGAADPQRVALGDAINVAARLQSTADPGTIVVGEATARRLAHRFLLEALGELQVKGRRESVTAWRLVGALEETSRQVPTPLVGRDRELIRIRDATEELRAGRGRLLIVTGESGIGKTRLLAELATIAGAHTLWLGAHTRTFGSELLYWPFVAMLRSWLGAEPGEPEVSVRTKLRSKLTSLPELDLNDVSRKLGALLGIEHSSQGSALGEDVGAEVRLAYRDWVMALSARQPIVLAIDDFQGADTLTCELAKLLLDVTERAPVLIAVAFRTQPPSEASQFRQHALENFSRRTTDLALEPLESSDAGDLLGMLLPDDLDAEAGAEVVARAEGNPLYLEELLRTLIEEGGLERRHRTWALTRTPARLVPAALEGLLLARIDQLPEQTRRLAQVAAVIGRSFPARVLERIVDGNQLEPEISLLLRAQMIVEVRRSPELVFAFKHGLVQECALSTLTPARREELYGAVAAIFEELYADARDEYLDVLASYYARSGNRAKALHYLELAGRRAVSLNANAAAGTLLNRALRVADEQGDDCAKQRLRDELDRLAATAL